MKPLSVFFGEEWDRFRKGFRGLSPDYADAVRLLEGKRGRAPDELKTISVPGWDQVIHLGPRPEVTRADWTAYNAARRTGADSGLSPTVVGEIERRRTQSEANRTSAQPEWSKTFGQIMTAVDNVQDFASTLATLGRLGIWGAPKVLDKLAPGFALREAEAIGLRAAAAHAAQLAAELGGRAAWNAAFIDGAAKAVARQVTMRAALGLGSRLALRAIPIVGWVLLASDLLNLMNFLGMVAMPVYGLLCSGPREALTAGVPAAVLKNALCREVWTMSKLNPFSRQARAARRLKALGRLPSVGNLIEVAQTTDSLFGIGLSIGSLYGAVMEGIFSAADDKPFGRTTINAQPLFQSLGAPYVEKAKALGPVERAVLTQATSTLTTSTALASKHDLAGDDDHLVQVAALVAALGELWRFLDGGPIEDLAAELLPLTWRAPAVAPRDLDQLAPGMTADDAGVGRWHVPGVPRELPGDVLLPQLGAQLTAAVGGFLRPRRNTEAGMFYGACVMQAMEHAWYMIGNGEGALRQELAPDFKILTGLAVDGLLIPPNENEGRAWRFWQSLHDQLDARGGRLLERAQVEHLAAHAGVTLVHLLEPSAGFPAQWGPFFTDPDAHWIEGEREAAPAPT